MIESIKSSNLNNADSLYSRFPGDNAFSKWLSEALANCFCTSCIDMPCQDIQHRDYTSSLGISIGIASSLRISIEAFHWQALQEAICS